MYQASQCGLFQSCGNSDHNLGEEEQLPAQKKNNNKVVSDPDRAIHTETHPCKPNFNTIKSFYWIMLRWYDCFVLSPPDFLLFFFLHVSRVFAIATPFKGLFIYLNIVSYLPENLKVQVRLQLQHHRCTQLLIWNLSKRRKEKIRLCEGHFTEKCRTVQFILWYQLHLQRESKHFASGEAQTYNFTISLLELSYK